MKIHCQDVEPVGVGNFFFAINATFRFILKKLGADAPRRYWSGLGDGRGGCQPHPYRKAWSCAD